MRGNWDCGTKDADALKLSAMCYFIALKLERGALEGSTEVLVVLKNMRCLSACIYS